MTNERKHKFGGFFFGGGGGGCGAAEQNNKKRIKDDYPQVVQVGVSCL